MNQFKKDEKVTAQFAQKCIGKSIEGVEIMENAKRQVMISNIKFSIKMFILISSGFHIIRGNVDMGIYTLLLFLTLPRVD